MMAVTGQGCGHPRCKAVKGGPAGIGHVACFAGEAVPLAPGCLVHLTESCGGSQ
jgi:hypothetical protein